MKERALEIDALKCVGILAVILIHSLRSPWEPGVAPIEIELRPLLRFAVPSFLFASGFLYATTAPVPAAVTRRRLRRLLVPYLVASLAAQVFWQFSSRPDPRTASVLLDLLFGWSFGPYYYVFVIVLLVLATPLFARIPRRRAPIVLLALLALQGLFETGWIVLPWRFLFRNPLLWAGYFYAGWCARLHHDALRAAVARVRGPALMALALLVAGCFALTQQGLEMIAKRSLTWLLVYASIAFVFVAACGRRTPPGPVRALSDATYAIYLLHVFFVVGLAGWLSPTAGALDVVYLALLWSAGLLGSLAVIALSRAILGDERSRAWLGA
ncbi:MAG: acyltransferase [Deltaproteobacteria bacterium]|nr:MAG: acyltransferase [Deltaproteobacteria bacterium]